MKTEKNRKKGRPPLPKGKAKREAIGLRTTPELKERLQKAADKSGRSLSQEAEFRIELSYLADSFLGGQKYADVARYMSVVIDIIESHKKARWTADYETFQAVLVAVRMILKEFAEPELQDDLVAEVLSEFRLLDLVERAREISKSLTSNNMSKSVESDLKSELAEILEILEDDFMGAAAMVGFADDAIKEAFSSVFWTPRHGPLDEDVET